MPRRMVVLPDFNINESQDSRESRGSRGSTGSVDSADHVSQHARLELIQQLSYGGAMEAPRSREPRIIVSHVACMATAGSQQLSPREQQPYRGAVGGYSAIEAQRPRETRSILPQQVPLPPAGSQHLSPREQQPY